MKALNTIQTLAKLGRIFSRIAYVFCLVGGILCAVGIVSFALIPDAIQLGGVTVRGLIEKSAEVTPASVYMAMTAGLLICAGEAVLCKLAERYFRHELTDGTPFTTDGARELLRLGICTVCVPVGARAAAEIACRIIGHIFNEAPDLHLDNTMAVGLGVAMIVMSLLCRYGAELEKPNEPDVAEAAQPDSAGSAE